jgi:hypothetical protein
VASLTRRFLLIVLVSLVTVGVVEAQQLDPPYVPTAQDSRGVNAMPGAPATGPVIPGVSEAPPTWAQERAAGNHPGTVTNSHQRAVSEDGTWYQREHVVTNPNGQRIQSWERSRDEEGYLYRQSQTFHAPDGTQIRQHERTRSGSDPYNDTRQHQVQLRDGRTIVHDQTRSWDGTSGTRERTFSGPNGQTRHFQRPWTPEGRLSPDADVAVPQPTHAGPTTVPAPRVGGADAARPPVEPPKRKMWAWLEKLNPFRKGGPLRPSRPASPPPGGPGFTIGSGHRSNGDMGFGHRSNGDMGSGHGGNVDHVPRGLSNRPPNLPSTHWRRPPWRQAPPASPPQRPSLPPSASRPRPSHGRQ